MQRLFFHNRHDKNSRTALSSLEPDVKIIDLFEFGNYDLLEKWRIPQIPYLVDKEFILDTTAPYYTPEFSLSFSCHDYLGNIVINESQEFNVEVNGDQYIISPTEGILTLDLLSDIPATLQIKIEGEGYYPWEGEIEVIENV